MTRSERIIEALTPRIADSRILTEIQAELSRIDTEAEADRAAIRARVLERAGLGVFDPFTWFGPIGKRAWRACVRQGADPEVLAELAVVLYNEDREQKL